MTAPQLHAGFRDQLLESLDVSLGRALILMHHGQSRLSHPFHGIGMREKVHERFLEFML